VYWLEDPSAPEPASALTADTACDLVVVGGGYTGLWTALRAKERDPGLDVVLVESGTCGWAASGRNGGFCDASLTHGVVNGLRRWPAEMSTLDRLGRENLDDIEAALKRYGIDCGFERTGDIAVATEPWQLGELEQVAGLMSAAGEEVELLDAAAMRAQVASPTYLGGLWKKWTTALVDPADLAWGLRAACLSLGVRLHENTPAESLHVDPAGAVVIETPYGSVRARHAALATNAFPPLLRRVRPFVVPVYDYVLLTEPLSESQLASIGWADRQGLSDSANQFHYYRLTGDNRILWGGYDAVYHYRSRISPALEARYETFEKLSAHFFATFPQLAGVRFTHRWGGVIDTSSRFCAFYGTAHQRRVAYALGFTGLGLAATRFGADVMLDLLSGRPTERTTLAMVHAKPLPFPPEPLRYTGIQLTRWSLGRADRNRGRRNLWLRALDWAGVGFHS
jgi:glycine/D-amino acid oxidase-like deaminating enzyme